MSALYLLAVLLVLVWGAIFALRGSLWLGCLVTLLVGYCFGRTWLYFEVGQIHVTLDRLILGAVMVAYVIQRRLGGTDPKPVTWGEAAMLLFAGLLVVSTFTHDWQGSVHEAGEKNWRIGRLLAGYLMPIVLYWIVRQSRLDRRALLTIYAFMTFLGIYLLVTALAEVTQQWWLVFPSCIKDPKLGINFGRARGPALQPQSLGLYLDVCLLCAWTWRRYLGRFGQFVLVLLMPAFLAAIFATYTRCVWIGMALGAMILLGLWLRGVWRPLVLGTAVASGLLVAVLQWDQIVGIERNSGSAAARSSVSDRASYAYVSWKMFLDHPLLGVGYNQFSDAAKPYLADRSVALTLEEIRGQPDHNTFLALLTETGLIGAGLFVAVLVAWGRSAWRTWRSEAAPDWVRHQGLLMLAALGVYLGPAMFFDLTYSPHDHSLLFFLAGITNGLRHETLGAAATTGCDLSPTPTSRRIAPVAS